MARPWWEEELAPQPRSRLGRLSQPEFQAEQDLVEEEILARDRADDSQSERALNQAAAQLQAAPKATKGLARLVVGDEGGGEDLLAAKKIIDREAQYAPDVQTLEDVHGVADAGAYARNAVLSNLPTLVPTIGAAAVTGGLSGLAGAGLRGAAQKGLAGAIGRGLTARAGAAVGAGATSSALQSTQMLDTALDEESGDDAVTRGRKAAVGAVTTGLIDSLPTMSLLNRMGLGGAAKKAVAQGFLKEAGKQALQEGSTEAIQTFGENLTHKWVNDNVEVLGPKAYSEYLNAAVAGGLVGGVIGGAPAVVNRGKSATREGAKRDWGWWQKKQAGPTPVDPEQPTGGAETPTEGNPAPAEAVGDLGATMAKNEAAADENQKTPGGFVRAIFGKHADGTAFDADPDSLLDQLEGRFREIDRDGMATSDENGIIGRTHEDGFVRGQIPFNGFSLFNADQAQMLWEDARNAGNGRGISVGEAFAMTSLGNARRIAEVGDAAIRAAGKYLTTGDRSQVNEEDLTTYLKALDSDQQLQFIYAANRTAENIAKGRESGSIGEGKLTPQDVRRQMDTQAEPLRSAVDIDDKADFDLQNEFGEGTEGVFADYQQQQAMDEERPAPVALNDVVGKLPFVDARGGSREGAIRVTNSKGNPRDISLASLVAQGWQAVKDGVFSAPNGVVDVVAQAIDTLQQRGLKVDPEQIKAGLWLGGDKRLSPREAQILRNGLQPSQQTTGVQETPGVAQVPDQRTPQQILTGQSDRPYDNTTNESMEEQVQGEDGVENMAADGETLRPRTRAPLGARVSESGKLTEAETIDTEAADNLSNDSRLAENDAIEALHRANEVIAPGTKLKGKTLDQLIENFAKRANALKKGKPTPEQDAAIRGARRAIQRLERQPQQETERRSEYTKRDGTKVTRREHPEGSGRPSDTRQQQIDDANAREKARNGTVYDIDFEPDDLVEAATAPIDLQREQQMLDALTDKLGLRRITLKQSENPGVYGSYTGSTRTITLGRQRSGNARLDTLLHELGHAIVFDTWDSLSPELQQEILDAYEAWLKSNGRSKTWGQVRLSRAPFFMKQWLDENGKDNDKALQDLNQDQLRYLLSMDEFFADSLSKALGKNPDTQSAIGQFFQQLVAKLRELYEMFAGSKYEPAPSFEKWVEQLVKAQQARHLNAQPWDDILRMAADGEIEEITAFDKDADADTSDEEKALVQQLTEGMKKRGDIPADIKAIDSRAKLFKMLDALNEGPHTPESVLRAAHLRGRIGEVKKAIDRSGERNAQRDDFNAAQGLGAGAITVEDFANRMAAIGTAGSPTEALRNVRHLASKEQQGVIDMILHNPGALEGVGLNLETMDLDDPFNPDENPWPHTRTMAISGYVDLPGREMTLVRMSPPGAEIGQDPIQTVIHESVHAATIIAEANNEKVAKELQDLLNLAREGVKSLGYEDDYFYGLSETQEFVAEALSNPEFQEVLRKVEDPQKLSLWKRLLNTFLRALGVPVSPKGRDLLDRTLRSSWLMMQLNAVERAKRAAQEKSAASPTFGSANSTRLDALPPPPTQPPVPASPQGNPAPRPANLFGLLNQADRGALEKALRNRGVYEQIYAAADPQTQRQLDLYGPDLNTLINLGAQLYADGRLNIGTGKGVFVKLENLLRNTMGLPSGTKVARQILNDYQANQVGRGYDGTAKAFDKTAYTKQMLAVGRGMQRVARPVVDKLATDMGARMRETNNPALRKLATLFETRNAENAGEESFSAVRNKFMTQHATEYMEAVKDLSEEQKRALATALQKGVRPRSALGTSYDKVNQLFERYLLWANANGVPIPKRKDYFPVVMDSAKVAAHRDELVQLLSKPEYEADIRHFFGNDQRTNIAHLIDRMVQIAETADASHVGEVDFSTGEFAPSVSAQRAQIMGFITSKADRKLLSKFQSDSLDAIVLGYVNQLSKKAAYRKVFGQSTRTVDRNGNVRHTPDRIGRLMAAARQQGATAEQLAMAKDFVNQALGSYNAELNPAIRWVFKQIDKVWGGDLADMPIEQWAKYQSVMQTYQNIRLLPLAALSSLIDPLGSFVRGGSAKDTMRSMWDAMKAMRGQGTDLRQMAEDLGIVEKYALTDALAATYGGSFDPQGKLGKINNALFRLNGLEAITRHSRLTALAMGHRFLMRHANNPNTHSERLLKELGLTAADVQPDPQRPQYAQLTPKVEQALRRFVTESVVRPQPSQRPGWHNDPNFMFASQYKGYLHAFYTTIVDRMVKEAEAGNYKQALLPLIPYLGVTVAAEMVRYAIQHPDEEDPRDIGDYMKLAMIRSGMVGPRFGVLNDARTDTNYGSWLTNSWIGPTGQQATDLVDVATGDRSFGKTAVEALPGSAIFEDWNFLNGNPEANPSAGSAGSDRVSD